MTTPQTLSPLGKSRVTRRLVRKLNAVFFEEISRVGGGGFQSVELERDDSQWRWGPNLRPTWQRPAPTYSPVVNYRWSTSRQALHELRVDPGSPFDGICLEYLNPQTGGPVLPTMSVHLQQQQKGERTKAHRHVASTVYQVAEGGGHSIIAAERFDWEEGDIFVVPAWSWHEHASAQAEAVLFSFSDRPVLTALGLEREQAHPADYQR